MEGLIGYLKHKYEARAIMWKGEIGEKKRFSKLYYDMIEALESLGTVDNIYVKIAIFKSVAQDETVLLSILNHYK